MKAFVEVCTNRLDDDTKNSFIELYTKVDAASAEQIAEQERQSDINSQMMTMIVSQMTLIVPSKSINHSVSPVDSALHHFYTKQCLN